MKIIENAYYATEWLLKSFVCACLSAAGLAGVAVGFALVCAALVIVALAFACVGLTYLSANVLEDGEPFLPGWTKPVRRLLDRSLNWGWYHG